MRARIFNSLVAFMVVLAAFGAFVRFWGEATANAAGRLIVGWLMFLGRILMEARVNWDAVATFVVCLLLIYVALHGFLRWFWNTRRDTSDCGARRWRMRWTALTLAVVVLMFVTGTAFIGIVHQVGWLAASRQKLTTFRLDLYRGYGEVPTAESNLHNIAFGAHEFFRVYNKTIVNGVEEKRTANHSWMARLLGFGLQYDTRNIHFELDWDAPANVEAFRRFVPEYLNPEIPELRDARGYSVSHFAGNRHVFDRPKPLASAEVTVGASNTILAGECASNFKAWGDPANLRDPAHGINKTPDGFGGPGGNGAHFAMLDGSVRFLSDTVDQRVLEALASTDR